MPSSKEKSTTWSSQSGQKNVFRSSMRMRCEHAGQILICHGIPGRCARLEVLSCLLPLLRRLQRHASAVLMVDLNPKRQSTESLSAVSKDATAQSKVHRLEHLMLITIPFTQLLASSLPNLWQSYLHTSDKQHLIEAVMPLC